MKDLTGSKNAKFTDFVAESFDFVQFSFKAAVGTTNCDAIALEMAQLQADNEAGVDFDVFQDISKLWMQLPNKHLTVRNRALRVLVRFGSTYVCYTGFSLVLFILKLIIGAA